MCCVARDMIGHVCRSYWIVGYQSNCVHIKAPLFLVHVGASSKPSFARLLQRCVTSDTN